MGNRKFENKNHFPFAVMGKKLGMTQIFSEDGSMVPVTVIELGPCVVIQKKTQEKDHYSAVQIAYMDKKTQRVIKPEAGHFKAAQTPVKRHIREIRMTEKDLENYSVGQVIGTAQLRVGDYFDVSGSTIGKGFQGVMRKYNFRGQAATHGVHEMFRHGGSIGNCTKPGKVWKNKKMPGQMGNKKMTIPNIQVVRIEENSNIIMLRGPVPGSKNSVLFFKTPARKKFEARPLVEEAPAPEAEKQEESAQSTT